MLIDDFLDSNREFIKMWPGIQTFRVEEELKGFVDLSAKEERKYLDINNFKMSSRPPFKYTCIHFSDCFLVVVDNENYDSEDNKKIGHITVMSSMFGFNLSRPTAIAIEYYLSTLEICSLNVCMFGQWLGVDEISSLDKSNDKFYTVVLAILSSIFMFFTLISCSNIRQLEHEISEKLQKKRKKRGKQPLISYKILEICVSKSGKPAANGKGIWTNRVHLCRGHMAEYGVNGKGKLFGKYSGRFWIPPHAKGLEKSGIIIKDYKISTAIAEGKP